MFVSALNFIKKQNSENKRENKNQIFTETKINHDFIRSEFNKMISKFDYKINKLGHDNGKDATTKSFYEIYIAPYLFTNTFIDDLVNLTLDDNYVYEKLWNKIKYDININFLKDNHKYIINQDENLLLNSFIIKIRKYIHEEVSLGIRTENGALSLRAEFSLSIHLNLFWKLIRGVDEQDIINLFEECWNMEKEQIKSRELLFRTMFHLRDFRNNEGKGERELFRVFMRWLATYSIETRRYWSILLSLVPEYGRWDDVYVPILDSTNNKNENISIGKNATKNGIYIGNISDNEREALGYLGTQIMVDLEAMRNNRPVTLAAKWAPSENSKWNKKNKAFYKLMDSMKTTPKKLRKDITLLRSYINIVESILSHGEDYKLTKEYMSSMPSQAIRKLKKALEKRSPEWDDYINQLQNNNIKINSSACAPYDWVKDYFHRNSIVKQNNDIIEAQWKDYISNLRKKFNIDINDKSESNAPKVVIMADTSGSMFGDRAIEVCLSLACTFARLVHSSFRDTLITFNSNPSFIQIPDSERGSLRETLEFLTNQNMFPWGGSTNLEGAFMELLKRALGFRYPADHPMYPNKKGLHRDDMPEKMIIISDMQFNACRNYNSLHKNNNIWEEWDNCNVNMEETNNQRITRMYEEAGYDVPGIIFWNVRACNDVPVGGDENNTVLLSGFSPSLFNQVLENIESMNPESIYLNTVMSNRYDKVIDLVKPLMEYETL